MPIVFPIHPRTRKRVEDFGLSHMFRNEPAATGIYLTDPLGYIEFLNLNSQAGLVLTDSGGLQEEPQFLACRASRSARTPRGRSLSRRGRTGSRGSGATASGWLFATHVRIRAARDRNRKLEKWDGKAAERIASHSRGTGPGGIGPCWTAHCGRRCAHQPKFSLMTAALIPNQEERGGQA